MVGRAFSAHRVGIRGTDRMRHGVLLAHARCSERLARHTSAECRGWALEPSGSAAAASRDRILGGPARLLLLPQRLDSGSTGLLHRPLVAGAAATVVSADCRGDSARTARPR